MMEEKMESNQLCRLCLENETDMGGILVEIFSPMINEPGKMNLSEKIRQLFGLNIFENDGLPSLVCHKCLVLTENCMDFRDKCLKNDEKLRLIFKVNGSAEEPQEQEPIPEAPAEAEIVEEDEEEVITLNPNKLYESSDESDDEHPEEDSITVEHRQAPVTLEAKPILEPQPVKTGNAVIKKEIYHCRYCDIVFSEKLQCINHELNNHNPVNPFECAACSFSTDQHVHLIAHSREKHNAEKPYLCSQCTKSFMRRSDLKKHKFVHSEIRLYSCNICTKSFTRNTNLTKHKRTHSENVKLSKCTLCPKTFYSTAELARHLEIHMDRESIVCPKCNQAFARRDKFEIHLKTHFENSAVLQIDFAPPIVNTVQPPPIVFYNQPAEYPVPQATVPMNFYTESSAYNMEQIGNGPMQMMQPKREYPIMNQLLTGLSITQMNSNKNALKAHPCGICSKTFSQKKDLDRHVMTEHTVKQFKCGSCSKAFTRRDKLRRHEKIHLIPQTIFNCSQCSAVFVREHLLVAHSKTHQLNGEPKIPSQLESFLASLPPISEKNGFPTMSQIASQQLMSAMVQSSVPESPVKTYPLNLSTHQNSCEPMNLSSDLISSRMEPAIKNVLDSDDDEAALRIVEEPMVSKTSSPLHSSIKSEDYAMPQSFPTIPSRFSCPEPMIISENAVAETKSHYEEPATPEDEISFPMSSRIAAMDKLEPLRDLPMEILNND